MAKITRKTQKTFGTSAGATGIAEYGTAASGSPDYSTDPDVIQTAAWETGWSAAALAGTEIPTFQDFNAIHFVSTRQIGYLLQEGIAEYDSGTEYYQNSIVKKSSTYELYGSKTDANIGNALPSQVDDTYWQYLGDLSQVVNIGTSTAGTGCSIYQTSGQSVPNATWTAVQFDAENYDDDGWHDNATNNTRVTVNFDGRVTILGMGSTATTANAIKGVRIKKNGTVIQQINDASSSGVAITKSICRDEACASGDYFEMEVYQSTDASTTTATGVEGCMLQIHKIK